MMIGLVVFTWKRNKQSSIRISDIKYAQFVILCDSCRWALVVEPDCKFLTMAVGIQKKAQHGLCFIIFLMSIQ